MCFAVPEKEVTAVAKALESRFRQALDAGRLSQVSLYINLMICSGKKFIVFTEEFGNQEKVKKL